MPARLGGEDLTTFGQSIATLREGLADPDSRSRLSILSGTLSAYEPVEVGSVIACQQQNGRRMVHNDRDVIRLCGITNRVHGVITLEQLRREGSG